MARKRRTAEQQRDLRAATALIITLSTKLRLGPKSRAPDNRRAASAGIRNSGPKPWDLPQRWKRRKRLRGRSIDGGTTEPDEGRTPHVAAEPERFRTRRDYEDCRCDPKRKSRRILRALAGVIGQLPADSRGPGTQHRAAAQLQRDFLYAPPVMIGTGMRSKYR